MLALLIALALSGTGLQGGGLAGGPVATPTTNGGTYVTATSGNLQLYVDPLGSDANACTNTGTSACKTIQGCINKIPKLLRHRAVCTVAAGNFDNFAVSGFGTDVGIQRVTAGLLIDGTLSTSTGLTSGTASGTATAGSAGTTNVFGTMTDGSQSWTVDNLQGRFVTITAGTGVGQVRTVCSNSASIITICGTWATTPVNGTTYVIQDSATNINTCGVTPPSGSGTVSTANTAIRIQSNSPGATVTLRGLKVSGACIFGIYAPDNSSLILNRIQLTTTAGTTSKISSGGPVYIDTIASSFSGTSGTHLNTNPLAAVNASVAGNVGNIPGPRSSSGGTVQNSIFINGSVGLNVTNFALTTLLELQFVSINSTGIAIGGPVANIQGIVIDCTATAGSAALSIGGTPAVNGTASNVSGGVAPDHVTITDCEVAMRLTGSGTWIQSANAFTVTNVTTGYDVRSGGLATFANASAAFAVSGNEISLDGAAVTGTYASIPVSGNCITSLNYGSRVCRD